MKAISHSSRNANASIAYAVIETASPEVLGALLQAALERGAELGRDAWLATSAAFDGDHGSLHEALDWLNQIAAGETI